MAFSMLGGSCPAPDVAAAVADQVVAGLDPVTPGVPTVPREAAAAAALVAAIREGRGSGALEAWSVAVAAVGDAAAAAAALPGPWSLAACAAPGPAGAGRRTLAIELGEALAAEAAALAAAGCPLVRVDEPVALDAGVDDASRDAFATAHRRLTTDAPPTHLTLALTGGSHEDLGARTLADLPYASFLFDLIDGPDDWRLLARLPGDRGTVCGVVHPTLALGDAPEILVWAALYAASTAGRGLARVGLSTTGDLGSLDREAARAKLRALGEGARIAGLPRDEMARSLDPRALDLRSAALGTWAPDPRLSRRPDR